MMRFILVDRVLRLEPGREAVILKNITNSEDFFADHFPGRPIMPGCLILETCDQAARLLLVSGTELRRLPRLERFANGKFRHFVQPGDTLRVHVRIVSQAPERAEVSASVSVGDRTIAQASLAYRLVDPAGDPRSAQVCGRLGEFLGFLTRGPMDIA